jgi:hypothetical protein
MHHVLVLGNLVILNNGAIVFKTVIVDGKFTWKTRKIILRIVFNIKFVSSKVMLDSGIVFASFKTLN